MTSYASSIARRGSPALMMPIGEMHIAVLLEIMLPMPASRALTPPIEIL